MYKIVYLPTAEIVSLGLIGRPEGYFNDESRARAFMLYNICVYSSYGKPYMHYITINQHHKPENVVPSYLLELIEVKDV